MLPEEMDLPAFLAHAEKERLLPRHRLDQLKSLVDNGDELGLLAFAREALEEAQRLMKKGEAHGEQQSASEGRGGDSGR